MNGSSSNLNHKSTESVDTGIMAVANQSIQFYEKMPMLQVVIQKLLQLLTLSIRNLTSEIVELTLNNCGSARFQHWVKSANNTSAIGIFKVLEWKNVGLVSLDHQMVFHMIDVLLGGRKYDGGEDVDAAPKVYTYIEQSIIRQIFDAVLRDLGGAFDPVSPSTFVLERLESNPASTNVARPGDAVIIFDIGVSLDSKRKGNMQFLIPYETIDPIKKELQQMFVGERNKDEDNVRARMLEIAQDINFEVTAKITDDAITLRDLHNLHVGDLIRTNCPSNVPINLVCCDRVILKGSVGKSDGKIAIKVCE